MRGDSSSFWLDEMSLNLIGAKKLASIKRKKALDKFSHLE